MEHVYILEASQDWDGKSLIKIGLSDRMDVSSRINEIDSEWREKRSIGVWRIHSRVVSDNAAIESRMHRQFKSNRLYNRHLWGKFGNECNGDTEWFAMTDEDLECAIEWLDYYARESDRSIAMECIGWAVAIALLGWILSPAIFRSPAKTATIAPPPKYNAANVRSGPSVSSPIVGSPLMRGARIEIIEQRGGWVLIGRDGNGDRWVARSMIKN